MTELELRVEREWLEYKAAMRQRAEAFKALAAASEKELEHYAKTHNIDG